ncbi:thiopeptide-type bacteriocin biosynthesis protein [Nostoc sp. CMAA1605]|uniref:thiopeptide-type bacteriocin biosynthesis protein n=1 Tax=Nostoc sp. CMAA1605 TaxID=2055159 RepID=UPI001F1AE915|nr:thiopeptide-type bacteriocin biosynthesis protein [Nostoc sp. CMAA1605]MCF4968879.1 hypothetical protein [Nostoc sp. CMAA1605]
MIDESKTTQVPSSDHWETGEWLQLNVGLVRHQGDALPSARVLFAKIVPLVNSWRSQGLLRWFFFMRKPPDVRIRFFTKVDQQQAIAEISKLMYSLQQENYIHLFFFSEYQPETERFGGTKAMQWVHQHFDIDTSQWLILDYLHQHHRSVVPTDVLLPSLLHDLFTRGISDQASVLTAWHSLGALIPPDPEATIPKVELFLVDNLYQMYTVTEQEKDVLKVYTECNSILAQKLVNFRDIGQLCQDLPDILAAVAMFTFHRHGFDGQRSGKLIKAIIRTLEGREN